MEKNERRIARAHLVTAMLAGQPWQEAGAVTAMPVKRAMAYRLLRAVRTQGPIARPRSAAGTPLEAAWRGSSLAGNILSSGSSYAGLHRPDATSRAVRREREYQPDQPGSQTTWREQPFQEPGAGEKTGRKGKVSLSRRVAGRGRKPPAPGCHSTNECAHAVGNRSLPKGAHRCSVVASCPQST